MTGAAASVTVEDIRRARVRVDRLARRTPVVRAAALSERLGKDVRLKLESLQDTGSFKVRGSANRLLELSERDVPVRAVTFSTGNHGRAVAHIGARLGIPVTVCVAENVPAHKLDALRVTGVELHIEGPSQGAAAAIARHLAEERGLELVAPFDDAAVVAGQGTIGLEVLEDVPDAATILVPLSGGGLLSGVALAVKSIRPATVVVGVSAQNCAAMWASQQAGRPVEFQESATLADSLCGGIGLDNAITFDVVRERVDELICVDEAAIAEAMAYSLRYEGLVLEGAAVVGIAALLRNGRYLDKGPTVVLVTGRNVALDQVLAADGAAYGRLKRFLSSA